MGTNLYARYIEAVREAVQQQPSEWTFKSDPRYREVLEHTPVEFALAMLQWSLKMLPELTYSQIRELCEINDSVGKPEQETIAGLGTYAPSNMRYLCHAIKLWQHIDSLGLDEVDIVEIGGGYGGLALYVEGLERYFPSEVSSYSIIDLPEVAELTNKVLRTLGLPWHYMANTLGLIATGEHVAVSAYAFSEFDQPTRDYYAERVLKHCRHGLMIWNFPRMIRDGNGTWFGGPPYQFVEWPITVVPDEPPLYDGHLQVTW